MAEHSEKYRRAIRGVLENMVSPKEQFSKHMENITEFETLFENANAMVAAGAIDESELELLKDLHNQFAKMTEHPEFMRIWTDDQFTVAEEWCSIRTAAGSALKHIANTQL